jgi:hypothetical protein
VIENKIKKASSKKLHKTSLKPVKTLTTLKIEGLAGESLSDKKPLTIEVVGPSI